MNDNEIEPSQEVAAIATATVTAIKIIPAITGLRAVLLRRNLFFICFQLSLLFSVKNNYELLEFSSNIY